MSGWLQTGDEGATGNTVEWDPWTEKWRVRVPPFAQFLKGLVNALPDSFTQSVYSELPKIRKQNKAELKRLSLHTRQRANEKGGVWKD